MIFERKEDQNSGIRWNRRLEVALDGKEDQKGDI